MKNLLACTVLMFLEPLLMVKDFANANPCKPGQQQDCSTVEEKFDNIAN